MELFDNYNFSDHGIGGSSSSNGNSPWGSQERWVAATNQHESSVRDLLGPGNQPTRAKSYEDIGSKQRRFDHIDEVMLDFQLNGSDSPYDPDEEQIYKQLPGMGPAGCYLRQKSWPEPERSPAVPLPRPKVMTYADSGLMPYQHSQWKNKASPPGDCITSHQLQVLQSLPDAVVHALLRDLQAERDMKAGLDQQQLGRGSKGKRLHDECRFCKNNGERELIYRSHVLKDPNGRVICPVLRAFVCKRCGATGDFAHTIKYCPLSTQEERIQSMGIMRSIRLASGRRRPTSLASSVSAPLHYEYGAFDTATSGGDQRNYLDQPLEPVWAALEQKLML